MIGGRYRKMKGLTSTTVFRAQLQTSLYCFLSQLTLAFVDPGRFPRSQIQEVVGFDDHSWATKVRANAVGRSMTLFDKRCGLRSVKGGRVDAGGEE